MRICDCAAPGLSMRKSRRARGWRGNLWRHGRWCRSCPPAKCLVEHGNEALGRHVTGHDEDRVAWHVVLGVKRFQIVGRESLERSRRADVARAVTSSRSVEQPRKRELDQLLGIVLCFEQRRQAILPDPVEIGGCEGRPNDDVRQDRQRVREACGWKMQIDVRRVFCGPGRQVRPQIVDGIGNLESAAVAGAFVQHVGGQARQAELSGRIDARSSLERELQVNQRHLVTWHHPYLQTVRQRALVDGGHVQRGGRTDDRRLRAVRRLLLECGDGCRARDEDADKVDGQAVRRHLTGSTISSARRSSGRKDPAAASMSETDRAR